MFKAILLGIIMATLFLSSVRAEDGRQLQEQCSAQDQTSCREYIAGIVASAHGAFCAPSETKLEQYVWATAAYLADHRQQLDQNAADAVITAIKRVFPCEADRHIPNNTVAIVMRSQDAAKIQSAITATLGSLPITRSQHSDGADAGSFAFEAAAVAKDDECSSVHLEGNFVGNLQDRIIVDGLYCLKSGQANDWETRYQNLSVAHPHS